MSNFPVKPKKSANNRKRWTKVVVTCLLIVIASAFIGSLMLGIVLNGGIDGILNQYKKPPDLNDQNITASKAKVISDLQSSLTKIEKSRSLTAFDENTEDNCYEGKNNFEIHDDFAYRCDYRIVRFYGFNGDFKENALTLENTLLNLGYTVPSHPSGHPLKDNIQEYYDAYYSSPKYTKGQLPKVYPISEFPQVGPVYEKGGETLEIGFGDRASIVEQKYGQGYYAIDSERVFSKKNSQESKALIQKLIAQYQYFLVIYSVQDYYKK